MSRSALLLLTLVLAAPLVTACGGSPPVATDPLVGVWAGEGRQWNDGDRSHAPDETWTVRVSVGGSMAAGYTGTIEYPGLQCGGSLDHVGPNTDPGALPGDAVFTEVISYGTERCLSGGTVLLRPSRRDLILAWAVAGRPTVAAARLERQD